jgi:hypothetical protein
VIDEDNSDVEEINEVEILVDVEGGVEVDVEVVVILVEVVVVDVVNAADVQMNVVVAKTGDP